MSILEAHNVSIRYMTGDFKEIGLKEYIMRKLKGNYHVNEFWADRDVSFTLEKGDMLGIIGSNGAGKSTLLKTISGIMEPSAGRIHREGSIAALLELGSGFDGDLTVRENTYLRGAMMGYSRKFMDDTYEQIIQFAELEDFQDRPFKQLSSGMKSRLAFSIASLVQPDLLILDEVLSVGDGAFRKKSEIKMREIIGGGATTILVSHSLGQIREMCNKVLWLHKGKQIAFGDDVEGICNQYQAFLEGGLKESDLLMKARSDLSLSQANVIQNHPEPTPVRSSPSGPAATTADLFPWRMLCKISIIAFLLAYLMVAMLSPTYLDGEGSSFELPMISLLNRMSFQVSEDDYKMALELFPEHASRYEYQFYQRMPKDAAGNRYPWYFGVYAPLCLPAFKVLLVFGLNPVYTLPITNALLLTLALWVVYHFGETNGKTKFFAILFLGLSPIIPYIRWESYEVAMFSFVVISMTFWLTGKRNRSAFFLSIAGSMNPTIMAFGMMMIADYFWDMFMASGKRPKYFFLNCVSSWKSIILYAVCFVPCLIPMVISYVSLGSIVAMSGYAEMGGVAGRFAAQIFDLNFGLFPYIPIALLLFIVISLKGIHQKKYHNFFTLLGVLATIFSYSIMFHINCGMSGISRYNAWLFPVIIMTVIFSIDGTFVSQRTKRVTWGLTALSFLWCISVVGITYGTDYIYWTPIAETVLDYAPQLYNPLPSTFNSRNTHIDGGYNITRPIIYNSKDGNVRKILVPPGMLEQSIELLWISSSDQEVFERQCAKVTDDNSYFYLNFPFGTSIKQCAKYTLGEMITFDGTSHDAHYYFTEGLSRTETDVAWTDGTEGTFRLQIDGEVEDDLVLQINLKRIYNVRQRMIVACGDEILFDEVWENASEPITVSIPANCVQERLLELSFQFPDAVSPKSKGESTDARDLAFCIVSFSLESERDYSTRMQYRLGSTVSFDGTEKDAHLYFIQGVSRTETNFAWTAGIQGRLRLLIAEEVYNDLILQINLDRIFNAPQRMIVLCGDELLFDEIIGTAQSLLIPVPAECVREHMLELSLQFPNAISPKALGLSEDVRSLAFGISSFSVSSVGAGEVQFKQER